MKKQGLATGLRWLFSIAMIAMLVSSMAPIHTARAQGTTTTSDLVLTLVSIPKHVKACQTFEVIFRVTNLGPDPASGLEYLINIPDPYQDIALWRAPVSLAVGETRTFSVIIQVVGFIKGEPRAAHVEVTVWSNRYPDISLDPNTDNNAVRALNSMIGKRTGCL